MSAAIRGSTRAVFFDRDGTLNRSAAAGEYIRRPEDLRLLPGAVAAVRRVNDAGLSAILTTNQRWLSTPGADLNSYCAIQLRLSRVLAMGGAHLDASYTCPHALNSCDCRKPLPGMLLHAAKDFSIDLRVSFMIGDSMTDVQAGLAVGATTFLISPSLPNAADRQACFVVRDIGAAIERILEIV